MTPNNRILQLDVLGSFDFYTAVVSLESVSSADFRALARELAGADDLTLDQFHALDGAIPVLAHELTHFIDVTSTCWGFRHLQVLDNAFRAHLSQTEARFHHLKTAHDHMRSLRLPRYYTLIGESGGQIHRPWAYDVSIGRRFRANGGLDGAPPIAFCRFSKVDGTLLARSPLSSVSLLETSAMAQELQHRYALLRAVSGCDFVIEERCQERRAINYLYDHRITEYSVCAHLVANAQRCSDVLLGYVLAGVLSRLVLNVAKNSYLHLAEARNLGDLFQIADDHEYVRAVREGLRGGDGGMLYSVMAAAMPPDSYQTAAAIAAGIDAALGRLGTSLAQLRREASAEIASAKRQLDASPSAILRRLCEAGARNFDVLTPLERMLPLPNLHLPKVWFGDAQALTAYDFPANVLADLDPDDCFRDLYPLEQAINNFAEACI